MFDYWHKCDLVKVAQDLSPEVRVGMSNIVFASKSTPEQWKARGDNFMEGRIFEQALKCYQKAGQGNEHLIKKAHAYCLLQSALQENTKLYFEAALKFLEAADYCIKRNRLDDPSSDELLSNAAMCLRKSQPPNYSQPAQLFEHAGKEEEAAQTYVEDRDIENFARLKEKLGQHNDIVQTLWNKPVLEKKDALIKAIKYEQDDIKLHPDMSASELLYPCAKFYAKNRDEHKLNEVLQYIPEEINRVKFLKMAKLYDKAFEILAKHNQFS